MKVSLPPPPVSVTIPVVLVTVISVPVELIDETTNCELLPALVNPVVVKTHAGSNPSVKNDPACRWKTSPAVTSQFIVPDSGVPKVKFGVPNES